MSEQDIAASGRYRDAFASREFGVLFGSFVAEMLGRVMANLALTVLVYRQTGSPLLSGITFAVGFLPYLFGGTLLSGVIDRVSPRRLLAGCDLVAATGFAVLAVPGIPPAALFAVLFAAGLAMPLSAGTRSGLLREIMTPGAVVPARSLLRLVSQSGQVAGYALGGMLLVILTPRSMLLVNAALLASSAVFLRTGLAHRPPVAKAGRAGSIAADSLRGTREVMRVPALRRIMVASWLVPMLAVVPEALAAPAVAHLGQPSSAAGLWLAAGATGSIIGEVTGVWLIPSRHRAALLRPLAAALFVPLLVFFAAPPFPVALALLTASGLSSAYLLGVDQVLLAVTPPPLLTRAFTVSSTGLMTAQGLGFALGGALAELMKPQVAIGLSAAAGLTVVALLGSSQSFTTPAPLAPPR